MIEIQDINIEDDDLFNDEEEFIYNLNEDILNAVNGGGCGPNERLRIYIVIDDVML